MPVSWQTRLFCSSATPTLVVIVSRILRPTGCVSRSRAAASASRRSWGMSFSDQTYRCAPASSTVLLQIGVHGRAQSQSFQRAASAAARPARRPNTAQSSRELPIILLRPCTPPVISPAAYRPSTVVCPSRADHEPAVLVVKHGIGEDRLGQRVDPRRAVAAQHVRQHLRRRSSGSIGRVSSSTAGRPSGVSSPRPSSHSRMIASATVSRGASSSMNRSPSAFTSSAPYARVVSGIE